MSATNVVLVHGARADGSSWSGVIERLQKAGYSVTAVQIPLTGLSEDVTWVRQVLSTQTGPTILVAHSYILWWKHGASFVASLQTCRNDEVRQRNESDPYSWP